MNKTPILERLKRPFAFRFFLIWKLPTAAFAGLRLTEADHNRCLIELPMRWRAQNPFKSLYFAAQMAAGEMSTGLLVLAAIDGKPPVSMLVTEARAEFFKKAASDAVFECSQGAVAQQAVERALATGEGQMFEMVSEGRLKSTGELVSRFVVRWSIKAKKSV